MNSDPAASSFYVAYDKLRLLTNEGGHISAADAKALFQALAELNDGDVHVFSTSQVEAMWRLVNAAWHDHARIASSAARIPEWRAWMLSDFRYTENSRWSREVMEAAHIYRRLTRLHLLADYLVRRITVKPQAPLADPGVRIVGTPRPLWWDSLASLCFARQPRPPETDTRAA